MAEETIPERTWATPMGLVAFGWFLLVLTAAWWILSTEPTDRLFIGFVGIALLAATGYGSLCRPRLRANQSGLTVRGLRGESHYEWSDVTVRTMAQQRFGRSTRNLEIDTHDEHLIVLSKLDLGAEPEDVGEALNELRPE